MSNRTRKRLGGWRAGRWGDCGWRSQATDWLVYAGFSTFARSLACGPALPGVLGASQRSTETAETLLDGAQLSSSTLARARLVLCLGGWVHFGTTNGKAPALRHWMQAIGDKKRDTIQADPRTLDPASLDLPNFVYFAKHGPRRFCGLPPARAQAKGVGIAAMLGFAYYCYYYYYYETALAG
jgi:hypothetical protein